MPGVYSSLHIEENRLKTFDGIDWPHNFISTETLAKIGFYYFTSPDQVRCHFCKVVVVNWVPGDSEVGEHLRWAPNCPLLRHRTTDNVPIQPDDELWELLAPIPEQGQDEPDNASSDSNFDDDTVPNGGAMDGLTDESASSAEY